jgi:hypothetical protein
MLYQIIVGFVLAVGSVSLLRLLLRWQHKRSLRQRVEVGFVCNKLLIISSKKLSKERNVVVKRTSEDLPLAGEGFAWMRELQKNADTYLDFQLNNMKKVRIT